MFRPTEIIHATLCLGIDLKVLLEQGNMRLFQCDRIMCAVT